MKKMKKRIKKSNIFVNTLPEIKRSELIGEYASDCINMGESTEERQSYLNGACSAWNIASMPESSREEPLRRAVEGYKRMNPGIEDAENFEHDPRILVQKKLKMFPDIKKVIIGAVIEPISDEKYRINIASTDDRSLLRQILGKGSGQR